jgi:hypothetical protein
MDRGKEEAGQQRFQRVGVLESSGMRFFIENFP